MELRDGGLTPRAEGGSAGDGVNGLLESSTFLTFIAGMPYEFFRPDVRFTQRRSIGLFQIDAVCGVLEFSAHTIPRGVQRQLL